MARVAREGVRRRFEERFTARRRATDYLAAYRGLIEGDAPHLRLVSEDEAPAVAGSRS